jgi:methionyl-tRNA formyltransferase
MEPSNIIRRCCRATADRVPSLTGLTVFRPTEGLDEGPIVLQKQVQIGPDDTVGTVYFERLFPLGVAALLEAADLVTAGADAAVAQDESLASYEGWCRGEAARIDWHHHVDIVYNLIRGCNPAPGAWTTCNGAQLQILDARKHPVRTFAQVAGPVGTIAAVDAETFRVNAQGGQIEVLTVRSDGGKKLSGGRFCNQALLAAGARLGG